MNENIRLMSRMGIGAGVGALVMYFFDPRMGKGRRARIRDRGVAAWNTTACILRGKSQDFGNRIFGTLAETRSYLKPKEPASDEKLTERVRSKLGRLVNNPAAVKVEASNGRVTLSGTVLADEVDRLISRVQSVSGVHEVENHLEIHQHGGTPALQGSGPD